MNKLPLICLAGAALLALASVQCPRRPVDGRDASAGRRARHLGRPRAQHWIADGRDDAPRKVYVFMDANCKYCTKFWSDARPWVNAGKVQLRHVMVAVIAPTSPGKAATLLADPDPAKRLSAFEQAHAFGVVRMMAGGPRHSLEDPSLHRWRPCPRRWPARWTTTRS